MVNMTWSAAHREIDSWHLVICIDCTPVLMLHVLNATKDHAILNKFVVRPIVIYFIGHKFSLIILLFEMTYPNMHTKYIFLNLFKDWLFCPLSC